MRIGEIINFLATVAPPELQESYDNAGLITGSRETLCEGVLVSLDITEEVLEEAVHRKCNLVVAHHPILFKPIRKLTGEHYVERALIYAIKNGLAIYAIHTNLDNISGGVNSKIADLLGLENTRPLDPARDRLRKLVTFVPTSHVEKIRDAIFQAGAGHIGKYDECSFQSEGMGTFRGGVETNPFVGEKGSRHYEPESRLEVVFPAWKSSEVEKALLESHPYEEVAYDIFKLENSFQGAGAGLVGEFEEGMDEDSFLNHLKSVFGLKLIRYTAPTGKTIKKVAVCGGAGSFLTGKAIQMGADAFITGDVKYHEFFEADGRILLADIGHFESEQFTIDLLVTVLQGKFLNFAVLKSGVHTNPINYYF